jgi:isoleucyl-tRNA synthetase
LYDALTVITKLIAPILPHTADEVWKFIPNVELFSVQIAEMPRANEGIYDLAIEHKWDRFIELRDEIFRALEQARKEKVIGNSLSAALHLYPDQASAELLSQFDRLDQLFIVSAVTLHSPQEAVPDAAVKLKGVAVQVISAAGDKCERCWIVTPEVGRHPVHSTVCHRCAEVVGEHYTEA